MVITKHTQDMGADSGQLSVQIHGSDSDPWIRSMDQIHGSNSWIESMDLKRKLARIGSHILCVVITICSSWPRKRPSGAMLV